MGSVLDEITKISSTSPMTFEGDLGNRHMIVTSGNHNAKTAYCFSVPIYHEATKGIVDLRFRHGGNSIYEGSNAQITVGDSINLQNRFGNCKLFFPGTISIKTTESVCITSPDHYTEISPTLNGLVFKVAWRCGGKYAITMKVDKPYGSINANRKAFSLMREKFVPLVTVSCIGTVNSRGEVIAPCEIQYQKISEWEYCLTFESKSRYGKGMWFEINMHDVKLVQDTTVDERHPKENNAFGGTAFLGKTDMCGQQWLYSRLQLSNLVQLQNKVIRSAVLHIPNLGCNRGVLNANRISTRFCSFGSTWENKISVTDELTESIFSSGYYHLDMTNLIRNGKWRDQNFVLRAKNSQNKPVVVSTGDSFYRPQILEVKYF